MRGWSAAPSRGEFLVTLLDQACVSTHRIFVHNEIRAEFVERLAARVHALRVGDPLLAETEVGPSSSPVRPPAWASGSTRRWQVARN